ncbi:hypothetical protein M1C57_14325 [Rhodococcus pyridinivorans]|uniref:hypothetical protein n=1 Tax=Rhodococcus pyridinivorans TaxID=103816 RepID=UPI00200B238F|nr:hypothetical protein [Rhodococcus pyridinivorans]UPW02880.1 hypothetical protein M1C57_14325 [Rhodococcus pyridinivorans]
MNKAGQSLTIQAEEMRLDRQPDPFDVRPLTDNERAEAIRAVIAAPDETGLCWVCEKLLPASHVLDGTVLPVAYGEPFSP